MLNHHSITKLIISLTLTLLQCYFFNTLSVDYINTGSVDLTLGGFTECDIPGCLPAYSPRCWISSNIPVALHKTRGWIDYDISSLKCGIGPVITLLH